MNFVNVININGSWFISIAENIIFNVSKYECSTSIRYTHFDGFKINKQKYFQDLYLFLNLEFINSNKQ